MASVYRQGKGWAIQIGAGNARRVRRIGELNRDGVKNVTHHVDVILNARKAATMVPKATVAWLADITPELHGKLVELGLVDARAGAPANHGIVPTLGKLWDDFLARRTDLKPWTRSNLKQTKRVGVEFFELRRVDSLTNGDAKAWRRWLALRYSTATVSGFIAKTRQLFNDAIDHKLLTANPFRGVRGGSQVNVERRFFVTREIIDKVIAAAPTDEWKCLIALARWAGVRVPSEVTGMRIADVDLKAGRLKVRSPKTARQGKPHRMVPIFPELRPHLERVIDDATDGQTHLLSLTRAGYNPCTEFARIIRRAGLEPWPKVFQNMRSTRETELAKEHPMHVVCAWIGNTEKVASRHYLQVTDADFEKAAAAAEPAAEGDAKSAAPATDQKRYGRSPETEQPRFPLQEAGNAVVEPYSIAQDRI